MEKKEITKVDHINAGGITLIPLSKITLKSRIGRRGITFSGIMQPDSVIVDAPSGRRAFRITGEEITLDRLMEEFPDISEKLEEV